MGGSRITLITFWEHSPSGGCFFVPIPLSTFLSLYPVHVAVGTPIGTFTDGIVSHHPHRSPHPVSTSLPHIVPNLSDPCPRKSGHRFGNIGNSWNLRVAGRNWNGYATANHPLNPFAFGEPFGNPATFSKPMGFF